MPSNTSFTGSWSGFSRSTVLASAVCLSPLDSSPSKTYKRALKFEVFLCFLKKITKNGKKSWNSWQGYVKMTSPRQVMTSYQEKNYTVMCRRKFWEKSPKEFWKSVMVQELLGCIIIIFSSIYIYTHARDPAGIKWWTNAMLCIQQVYYRYSRMSEVMGSLDHHFKL